MRGVKRTEEEVFKIFNEVHNNKYTYPDKYINRDTPMRIICPKHGEYFKTPHAHMKGSGCKECSYDRMRMGWEEFKRKARIKHNSYFTYPTHFNLDNNRKEVPIICPEHGLFWQMATRHLSGDGCKECALERAYVGKEEIVNRAIKFYGELKDELHFPENPMLKDKIQITCTEHNYTYEKSITHYLKGWRCPICSNNFTKPEMEVQSFVEDLGYSIKANDRTQISPLELDIYVPELNKAIEFNGTYWHYSDKYFKPGKHANKSNLCKAKGINLLHIREDLWIKDESKMKEVIIKFLNHEQKLQ